VRCGDKWLQGLAVDILRNRITPRRDPHAANAAFIVGVSERNAGIRRAWQETTSLTHRMQASSDAVQLHCVDEYSSSEIVEGTTSCHHWNNTGAFRNHQDSFVDVLVRFRTL